MEDNLLLVGLDVARQTFVACLMDGQGQLLAKPASYANANPGVQQLVERLLQVLQPGAYTALRIAVEATGWYWFPCFQALRQDPRLAAWPVTLYTFNPRRTAYYAATFSDLDKTDPNDAQVIADYLRTLRKLPHPFTGPPPLFGLRLLTRYRFHLSRTLAREKQYANNIVYLKASAYQPGQPFTDVFGAASRAVLAQFASRDALLAEPVEELAQLLAARANHRLIDPLATAQALHTVAAASYPLAPDLQPYVDQTLHWSLDLLTGLERRLKQIDRTIADLVADIPQTIDSIPGVGPVCTAGILAELGDIRRFDGDEAKVAQYAGLRWRQRQSGAHTAAHTPLTGHGNHYLRYYFCEAANVVRMHDAEYAAYYQRKHDEVRHYQHRRALVFTARKLVRLVVRLLTTHERYRPVRRPAGR